MNRHVSLVHAHRLFGWMATCCVTITTIAACSRHEDATTNAPVVVEVSMKNVQFSPASLEVKVGTIVDWKNDDLVPHTVTAASFDSGSMSSGQSWRHTFTETGTFPYACSFHPPMKGVIIVK